MKLPEAFTPKLVTVFREGYRAADLRDLAKKGRRRRPHVAVEWIGHRRDEDAARVAEHARGLTTSEVPAEDHREWQRAPRVLDGAADDEIHREPALRDEPRRCVDVAVLGGRAGRPYLGERRPTLGEPGQRIAQEVCGQDSEREDHSADRQRDPLPQPFRLPATHDSSLMRYDIGSTLGVAIGCAVR